MEYWHAFIEEDNEGNECVYLQNGDDESTRELFEMVEADIAEEMEGQIEDYLVDAEDEARERNAKT